MSKSINWGGAQMTRRSAPSTGPRMPAVPIPRKIQALIKMREQKGGGAGRVIQAGGGGCNMAGSQVVSTVRNLPKVYSPLYEFSNLMLPRDMKTMNAWNRQFFACVDDQTQTLTDNGWKYYWEIDSTKDKIGIFNPKTEELEFQFGEMFVYDYDSDADGPMFHFQTKKIDTMTTAQHRMWVDSLDWRDQSTWKNEWKIVEAQDVKQYQHRFRSVVRWSGNEPQEQYIDVAGEKVPVDQYLQYLGLFLSEGWVGFSEASTPAPSMVGIAQNEYRKKVRQSKFDVVATAVHCMPFAVSEVLERYHESNHDVDGKPGITSLNIYGKDFASHFLAYGRHSEDRFIPKWIKNLTTKYLQILLNSLICGDGTISYSDSYDRLGTNHVKQVVYSTASKRLADDVCEITLRCGYVPTLATHQSETTLMYLVKISDSEKGHYPVLKSNAKEFRGKEKQEVSYKGKVYCFHVPPHNLFVVRRNGKITITGNTNPIVRNAITLHATYPISKFSITCEDPKVKEFFEDMFDRMGFRGVLMGIALEFWKLGEAIPYLELDEENGVWDYAFLHNPDFIRVKTNALARYPAIYLVPDDSLRRLVQGRSSADAMMRQQLPAETAFHIMKGEDIPLPNFNVSHLKMMNSEYDVRGTSIITSCYKDLMLYDKLREMQFAQADGMINPLTLVKLGDPLGSWRPNDEDIRAFQQIMEESQYDPDFKIVTHGAVDIQRIGYSGATLDVSQMWDAINKNLYTGLLAPEAILNGEGANYCHDISTEVLTSYGYLKVDEIVEYDVQSIALHTNLAKELKNKDLQIACFNPETECIEYHSPIDIQVFNYDSDVDGEMVHFHTKKIDLMTTPNHKMWVDRRKTNQGWHNKWDFQRADEVNGRIRRFRSVVKWVGEEPPSIISVAGKTFDYKDYLQFVGLYATEGHAGIYKNKAYGEEGKRYTSYRLGIAQSEIRKNSTEVSESFTKAKDIMAKLPFEIHSAFDKRGQKEFVIYNKDLVFYMAETFGQYSENKHLTPEIKNLPCEYLRLLLDTMVLGDGHVSTSNQHSRRGKNNVKQYQFFSTSKHLANDVYEIAFKVGYAPIMRLEVRNRERDVKFANSHNIWWVEWSDSEIGNYPTLDTRSKLYPDGAISRVSYKGRVFCFTVPHNLFVVRRNGKQSIQGNSSASIGLEVLRTRYDRFREQLAQWVEKKVLEPICKLQDFYMTKGGVRKLIIPKVQWNRLNLRDMDSYTAAITGLLATPEAPGKVSDRVLFESLDLDYEEEKKCLRKEAIDRAAMAQELQALGKMSLEELQTLDPDKPIVDTHKGEAAPMSPEQMLGGPGGPGGLPGGLPGGKPPRGLPGGMPGRPPRAPVGEGGKPPAGGTPTAPTPGGAPTPVPGGPPPAAPKGPAPGA